MEKLIVADWTNIAPKSHLLTFDLRDHNNRSVQGCVFNIRTVCNLKAVSFQLHILYANFAPLNFTKSRIKYLKICRDICSVV